jgi:hypothetical protein
MDSQLPAYLKSLEAIIGSNSATSKPSVVQEKKEEVSAPAVVSGSAAQSNSFTFSPSMFVTAASMTNSSAAPASVEKSDNKKLRLLLVSTHIQQFTGYSKVSYNLIQQLAKLPWLEVIHYGFQRMPNVPAEYRPYPSNVECIDAMATEKPAQQGFNFTGLPDIIRKKQPHVVMVFNDMSVVAKYLEEIRKSGIPRNFKLWVYCDQVYNTQLQGYLDILNRDADCVFAFSPHWKKCLKDQGITRPLDVILHGFDSKMFFPLPKELVRKQVGLPADSFMIMNMNRNQPRKRYDILIMAFVELIVKYPTKPIYLMCVCDKGEKGGWWLFELFHRELRLRKVPIEMYGNRLLVSAQDMIFKDEDVNMFYNLADVGINTADGEGWGLCNFEQMGCGIPQVVPEIGGFKEFCTSENSVLVKPKVRYYHPMAHSPVGGEAEACDPHDVCLAIEEYLMDSDKRTNHGRKARETALSYTWEKAATRLIKRLEEEKQELSE